MASVHFKLIPYKLLFHDKFTRKHLQIWKATLVLTLLLILIGMTIRAFDKYNGQVAQKLNFKPSPQLQESLGLHLTETPHLQESLDGIQKDVIETHKLQGNLERIQKDVLETPQLKESLDRIQKDILQELEDFNFSDLSKRANANSLNDLTYANEGKPIMNYIVTTFRSGSNFITDLLHSFPGTYLHHEPLIAHNIYRLRDEKSRENAYKDVREFFNCDFSNQDKFLNMMKAGQQVSTLSYNKRVWKHLDNETYYTKEFLSKACKQFPMQLMKTTRVLLRGVRPLLEDRNLNLKVLFLIRDPRGLLSSRWRMHPKEQVSFLLDDWNMPSAICHDDISDYMEAKRLSKAFPTSFKVIRYEDFALNPLQNSQNLFNFLGLPFLKSVKKYVETHTQESYDQEQDWYSTFRNTNATVFKWTKELTFEEVDRIQNDCRGALKLWGYKLAKNEEDYKNDFMPLLDYNLDAITY